MNFVVTTDEGQCNAARGSNMPPRRLNMNIIAVSKKNGGGRWFLLPLQFSTGPSKLFKFPEIVKPLPSLGGDIHVSSY
jgi:hypothetical protein